MGTEMGPPRAVLSLQDLEKPDILKTQNLYRLSSSRTRAGLIQWLEGSSILKVTGGVHPNY
jgi:hypothetical protein